MSRFFLFLAGCIEILGVIAMKKLALTKRKTYLLATLVQFSLSFGSLSLAMREISMATAYAIWTDIGATGDVIVGVVFFKESKSLMKLFFLGLILASSVGLKWIS